MHNATAEQHIISPEEYIAGEQLSDIRHEYIDGDVYAMAGGSDAHARISLNTAVSLKSKLRGSGCSTYANDMKAQASDSQYFYPDVMVTCDPADNQQNYSKLHPILIIEVLSASTEAYDRGKKFAYYRQIDSLQEYMLISQTEYHVDLFRKNSHQRWELFSFLGKQAVIDLGSLDCQLNMADLYEDVDFSLNEGVVAG